MASIDNFMRHVDKQRNGCWNWTGSLYKNGYARFMYNGACGYGHRFSYEYFKGKIPIALQIDHLCRNKRCVNPEHLEVVTLQENIRRFNSTRTHCKRGHEFTKDNTYLKNGKRYCKKCRSTYKIRSRKTPAARSVGIQRDEMRWHDATKEFHRY